MPLLTLDNGFIQPRSNMGVATDPYEITETKELIVFNCPVPGLGDTNVSVKVVNDNRLVIRSLIATKFCPKFRYMFRMPSDVLKEDINAFIKDGILYVKLIKNK